MLTNHAPSVWRRLAGAVVVAACLPVMACGSSPARQAAATEPVLHAFVGRFTGQPALKVALLVGRDWSLAYICDNHLGGVLLRGSVHWHGPGGTAQLTADDGITLSASFAAQDATGSISLPGQATAPFTAQLASRTAGLYEASAPVPGGLLQGRWIVGNDGEVAGMARLNGHPAGNPALQPTVTVGAATLTPHPVAQLAAVRPVLHSPVGGPVIDNAFSWRCGGDFHVDGHNFNPAAPVQILVDILVPEVNFVYVPLTVPPNGADGSLNADFAYILGPTPTNKTNNADVAAVQFPGQPDAASTHTSAYIC